MISISVVIPTYNRPVLLKRAIMSVLKQKSDNVKLEVVVVDDCSETTVDLSEFAGAPIIYDRLSKNSGPQNARNHGLLLAQHDWVVMLDDDDEIMEGTLNGAVLHIKEVPGYERYPVFFFATTNGSIPEDFLLVGPAEIMNETLKGDFTPIMQRKLFLEKKLSYLDYPEIVGVGCEQLTWLHISAQFSLPAFRYMLVKVNADAPLRLTSYKNFIRNSNKFALQQDLTIDFVRKNNLEAFFPPFVRKKYLGAAIYYLISGQKTISAVRRRKAGAYRPVVQLALAFLTLMPVTFSKFFFRNYKMRFSK